MVLLLILILSLIDATRVYIGRVSINEGEGKMSRARVKCRGLNRLLNVEGKMSTVKKSQKMLY
jgi:hypothetical protein